MSGRRVLVVNAVKPVPVNMQVPGVRVEIRMIFPHGAPERDVLEVILEATGKSFKAIHEICSPEGKSNG